jgi:predicted dehydrogenase
LLADDDIELVINLTPPSVHRQTCLDVLEAGNHVYVEKPLAASFEDATEILDTAETNGLLLGSAPDTFLGARLQTVRSVVDSGRIGEPVGATVVWASGGHENWHPAPDLYYQRGGGPLFDMGPYYVTALVSVLGAASRLPARPLEPSISGRSRATPATAKRSTSKFPHTSLESST